MKTITALGKKVLVHEIFVSRQGEGLFAGEKQIFLRFARCNLACVYCDTDNSIGAQIAVEETVSELERLRWSEGPIHSLSLTGGEPLLYPAAVQLVGEVARQAGLRVLLETNGTLPQAMRRARGAVDIVSMDLKLPSVGKTPAFWHEHAEFLQACRGLERYVKIVLSSEADESEFEQALDIIAGEDPRIPTVLQPVTPHMEVSSISEASLRPPPKNGSVLWRRLQELALSRLWDVRIQPQWHKMWNIR